MRAPKWLVCQVGSVVSNKASAGPRSSCTRPGTYGARPDTIYPLTVPKRGGGTHFSVLYLLVAVLITRSGFALDPSVLLLSAEDSCPSLDFEGWSLLHGDGTMLMRRERLDGGSLLLDDRARLVQPCWLGARCDGQNESEQEGH